MAYLAPPVTKKTHLYTYYFISPGAVVGLEETFFRVSENIGLVELCVNVSFPGIECPIEFPFNVRLSTRNGIAGDTIPFANKHSCMLYSIPQLPPLTMGHWMWY